MKVPHHLVLARSGIWHFRRRVPTDLIASLGRKAIKKSLRTKLLRVAQVRAWVVASQYDVAFDRLRASLMKERKPRETRAIDLEADQFDYTIKFPDGLFIQATDEADHARAIEALRVAGEVGRLAADTHGVKEPPSATSGISVEEAARKWLLTLEGVTKRKTLTLKRAAVLGFARWAGSKALAGVTRTDISEWLTSLRTSGTQARTLKNKESFLGGFFEWAMGAGHYPKGDNPARGQVKFGAREKQQRKKHGFRAFTPEQLKTIYSPENIGRLSVPARWAALIGLHTGARVAEIGQLRVDDVREVDDVWCFCFTDAGEGQSLKTEASRRVVPLHPNLIDLGFLGYVSKVRNEGHPRIFHGLKLESVNGQGSAFSSAFSRHLAAVGIRSADTHKIGFHSLRKTVVQAMQDQQVPSEFRAQYVGHELHDEHHDAYSRAYTPRELAKKIHPALAFDLDVSRMRDVLMMPNARRGKR
jgi:integrase